MTRTQAPAASTPTVFLEGRATLEGTKRYRKRFSKAHSDHFYRELAHGPLISSVGLGTYLGECDDLEDARYTSTIGAALENGVNLLDTAINYRCQRSERAVGAAVRHAIAGGIIKREEVVVCTKGGYIPLDGAPPTTKEGYREFLDSEYFERGVMTPADVVAGGHCLSPRYLEDQLDRSRNNLGLDVIDIYYIHNPEQQLEALPRLDVLSAIRDAFASMEAQVRKGRIGAYGCATWNGFRVAPEAKNHLSLEELVSIAREVGGARHHFKIVQLPINLGMTEAVRLPTQSFGADRVPLLEAARQLGVSVIASATLMQSQLARSLPDQVRTAFPGFKTDARRAIAFTQSLPLAATLVGMKSRAHLEENIAAPQSS
ncbi:MAG TPA: aldo/keto reductase [Gemmatimonadaceae bacterium]|jgi:aryl-alcohol dehydrogenase-like predicted oxidoreductase|nr:aldo/keto reductase [Gemmatimonadaceae bacterium]